MNNYKKNDVVQLVHNVHVLGANYQELHVKDAERNLEFYIKGDKLIETLKAADHYSQKVKLTKTEIVETLLSTHGGIFTVCFDKQGGEKRTLRGYLAKTEPLLGRSYCVDIDVKEENKLRLVDHRTIHYLIFNNSYYYV